MVWQFVEKFWNCLSNWFLRALDDYKLSYTNKSHVCLTTCCLHHLVKAEYTSKSMMFWWLLYIFLSSCLDFLIWYFLFWFNRYYKYQVYFWIGNITRITGHFARMDGLVLEYTAICAIVSNVRAYHIIYCSIR